MTTTMSRAAVLRAPNAGLSVEDVRLDAPRAGEVLVRIAAAGVCHSDRLFMTGDRPIRMPSVIGHEGAGVVEAVGEGVDSLVPGDHVIQLFVAPCGRCHACTRGRPVFCDGNPMSFDGTMLDGTYRFHDEAGDIGTGARLGSYSTHTVSPEQALVKIRRDLPFDVASLIGCGVTTGLGAAIDVAEVRPGDRVAVMGVGGVGASAILGAALAGASSVIAVDVKPNKLEFARMIGATHGVDATQIDVVEAIRGLTDGYGADKVIIAIDHVGGAHIRLAVEALDTGGRAVIAGLPEAGLESMPVPPGLLLRQRSIVGTLYGGLDPRASVLRAVELAASGRLDLGQLITKRYALDEINVAFDDLVAGRNLRGVIINAGGEQ
ncbi:MAG: alcohol dehydrogenase catalytic domain-containing protein [Acidimicrobiia bacterium]